MDYKDMLIVPFISESPMQKILPTLSEIWKSPEWKAQAVAFKEGKPCAWCRAKPGDTYTTKSKKSRKFGFSVHHIEKHKWGLSLYNQVKNKMFRKYWQDKTSKPLFLFPTGLSRKEYREQLKYEWENSHKEDIQTAFQEKKELIINDYLNLTEENAVVLCNRCHYARERGMVLCKICGKGYHKPKYDRCWKCSQVQKKGEAKDEEN